MKYFTILAIVLVGTCNVKSSCVPESVTNIKLDSSFYLTWTTADSNCNIVQFVVDITDHKSQHMLTPDKPGVALPFLLSCQNYTINIRGISDEHVSGPTAKKEVFTSISKDADLRVSLTTPTVTSETLTFSWELNDHSLDNCVSSYEVSYCNEVIDPVTVIQPGTTFTILDPLSCMNYTLKVKPLLLDSELSAPTSIDTVRTPPSSPPSGPIFAHKEVGTNFATLNFTVPPYEEDRCEFSLVAVVVGPNFHQQYSLIVPGNTNRNNSVIVHIYNLKPDYEYDGHVWEENDAGTSNNVTFILQTNHTILESYL